MLMSAYGSSVECTSSGKKKYVPRLKEVCEPTEFEPSCAASCVRYKTTACAEVKVFC